MGQREFKLGLYWLKISTKFTKSLRWLDNNSIESGKKAQAGYRRRISL
jgi:hypothetical protein